MVRLKKDPRKYQLQIWFLLVFFIAIASCVYISRFLVNGSFVLGVNPRDLGITYYFSVGWSRFLQIIFLGPVFGIIYFTLMKILLKKVDINIGKRNIHVFLIELGILTLVALNSMGHVLHLGFDAVNFIDKTGGEALNDQFQQDFLFIWYMDEWLGHTLVHATYFGYLILAVVAELLVIKSETISLDEFGLVLVISYFISVLDAQIAMMSECAFFLLILHVIFTSCAVVLIIIKKIKIQQCPILLAMLISLIPVILLNLSYILANGIEDYYPFYSSNIF